jgi:DNA modification methylase
MPKATKKKAPEPAKAGRFRDRVRELRRVRAGDLRASPKNWRTHPQHQRDALSGVLAEVGYADALIARETPRGLELIDGHLRKDLDPDQVVPVLVVDVTEAEAAKLLATLDPISALAGADAGRLEALLAEVSTGSEALDALFAGLTEGHDPAAAPGPGGGGDDFDAAPEESGPARTSPGELWVIGGKHRLLVGDCTVKENVERLLGGETPLLMVTDPPYGVEYDPDWRNEAAAKGHLAYAASRVGQVANDGRDDWTDAYRLFPGDVVYCWHAGRRASSIQQNLLDAGFEVRAQIVWAKPSHIISRGHYHWQHEPCWYAVRKGATARWSGDRSQTTLWQIPLKDDPFNSNHGTQKPLECMARPVRNHGAAGDVVYDPFLGSGTTLVAAHRLGRRCYGCELEPRYADVILRRAEAEGLAVELAGAKVRARVRKGRPAEGDPE